MPGSCKSTLVLDLAAKISTGSAWFGHRTARTPAAWISGEASDDQSIARDLHRLSASRESDILVIFPDAVLFKWNTSKSAWETTDEGGRVLQKCRDCEIGFLVIDTVGSVVAGLKEIDNDQTRQLARHIRAETRGMTVITISHTNQQSAKDSLDWRLHYLSRAGGNGFPGAIRWAAGTSKLNAGDAAGLGNRVSEEEIAQSTLIGFGVSKYNEIPKPTCNNSTPMIFELLPDGGLSLVADGGVVGLYQRAHQPGTERRGRKNGAC